MPDPDTREDKLLDLLKEYGMEPTDYDEGEEEDPRPYFNGEASCEKFVCVTVNYTSHGHAKYFFLPTFDTAEGAMVRAELYAHDDIFEELPVAVIDLDTGARYTPERIVWKRREADQK